MKAFYILASSVQAIQFKAECIEDSNPLAAPLDCNWASFLSSPKTFFESMVADKRPLALTDSSRDQYEIELNINSQDVLTDSPMEYLGNESVILSSMNRNKAVEKSRWNY